MSTVIRIQGLVSGQAMRYDGQYLKRFDYHGCELGQCNMDTVREPAQAMQFPSSVEAWEFWKQVDPRQPVRPDGQPNRPLTAFSVTLETVR